MMHRTLVVAMAVVAGCAAGVVPAMGQTGGGAGMRPSGAIGPGSNVPEAARIDKVVRTELDKALTKLAAGPSRTSVNEIEQLLDVYLAYGTYDRDAALLTDLTAAWRLARQTADAKNASAKSLAPFLVANPELNKTLAFLVRPEDDVPGVYAILEEIRGKHEKELTDARGGNGIAQPLACAVAVVYDKPPAHPVLDPNGKGGLAPAQVDAMQVFEFFLGSEGKLQIKSRVPRVWVNIVDVHSDMDDLRWAQAKYAGNQQVGRVYSSIVYDTASFKFGQPKKIFKEGYTLKGIQKVGGVCTEQAYFASEVAKSIGVPSVYVTGDNSDVGHAWVGYMKNAGGRMAWDFTEGRFGDYKTAQGHVTDPQTGKPTTDAFTGLTEWLVNMPRERVWEAGARTDAAAWLAARAAQVKDGKSSVWPPAWPTGEGWGEAPKRAARAADMASALAELREGLTACPGWEPAWRYVMFWSEKGMLDGAQKREWGDLIMKMAGRDRPDFAFAAITPMIRSAESVQEQSRLWDWAASEFQRRPDLVSSARLYQAMAWEKAGESGKAWDAYKDVITRFANDGRSVLVALARAEALLRKEKKDKEVVGLYEDAFRRVSRPQQMSPGFEQASNYYQVGARYAMALDEAGRAADATRIRKQAGVEIPGAKTP